MSQTVCYLECFPQQVSSSSLSFAYWAPRIKLEDEQEKQFPSFVLWQPFYIFNTYACICQPSHVRSGTALSPAQMLFGLVM